MQEIPSPDTGKRQCSKNNWPSFSTAAIFPQITSLAHDTLSAICKAVLFFSGEIPDLVQKHKDYTLLSKDWNTKKLRYPRRCLMSDGFREHISPSLSPGLCFANRSARPPIKCVAKSIWSHTESHKFQSSISKWYLYFVLIHRWITLNTASFCKTNCWHLWKFPKMLLE